MNLCLPIAVLAPLTPTLISALDSQLEALAVSFATPRFLTSASLPVFFLFYFLGESLRVPLHDFFFGSLNNFSFVILVAATNTAAVGATDGSTGETLAIEFQAFTSWACALIRVDFDSRFHLENRLLLDSTLFINL